MRARALTQTIARPDVAVIVESYKCQDHSTLNKIGAQAKHRSWKVRAVGGGAQPLQSTGSDGVSQPVVIEADIDQGVAGLKGAVLGTQVAVKVDGTHVYPEAGRGRKAKLHDDFRHEWNFRGTFDGLGLVAPGEQWIPGMLPTEVPHEPGFIAHAIQGTVLGEAAAASLKTLYQVHLGGERLPAVLTKQWSDGFFEVSAFKPDASGIIREVHLPSVNKSDIFLAETGSPIQVPESMVALDMQRANPQDSVLSVDGVSFKYLLGRVSPSLAAGASRRPRRIAMDVPKRRQVIETFGSMVKGVAEEEEPVTVDVGASVLRDFINGTVYRGDSGCSRFQKWWAVQLGPFAQHKIQLKKNRAVSPVMSLFVDDELLAECTSADLGGLANTWRCEFSFVGEKSIDFNVFEETKNGVQLDSQSVVSVPHTYKHVIEVTYQHRALDNLAEAMLTIDGVAFSTFPSKPDLHNEPTLSVTRDVLACQYGIHIPKKVLAQDTRGTARLLAEHYLKDHNVALNPVAVRTADELGSMVSKMTADAVAFCSNKLQSSAWGTALAPVENKTKFEL